MRTSMAYFAGVGTVVAAVTVGLGGGLIISNVVSPHEPKTEMSRLEQRMSTKPIPATNAAPAASEPNAYLAATAPAAAPTVAPPKPKAAAKPAPQKNYALLSDIQIAGIKERLKLSASQESYWPPVETALKAVARKIHAKRQADPNAAGGIPIDPEAEEVQQLKSAAMPLLFQLREDQKSEVRSLARIIGLEKVASMI